VLSYCYYPLLHWYSKAKKKKRERERKKSHTDWKYRTVSIPAMTVYRENLEESTKRILELVTVHHV